MNLTEGRKDEPCLCSTSAGADKHALKTLPPESNLETPAKPAHVYLVCYGKRTKCANFPEEVQSRLPNTALLLRKLTQLKSER